MIVSELLVVSVLLIVLLISALLAVSEVEVDVSEVVVNSELLVLSVVNESVILMLVVAVSDELLAESVVELVKLQDNPESVTVIVIEFADTVKVLSIDSAAAVTVTV